MKALRGTLRGFYVLLLLSAGMSRGEIIIIGLSAEVTYMDENATELLDNQLSLADTITGYYTYDSETPDNNPNNALGAYRHLTMPYGVVLFGGGFTFQTDPADVDFFIGIDDGTYLNDTYWWMSYNNLPLSNGVDVDGISWYLDDYSYTALSSDALPLGPPVLSDWQYQGLTIELGPKGGANIGAQVSSV